MSKTKDRIRESNLRYKQSLGQNFIYDEDLLRSLVADAEVGPEEDVLEIGPGAGSLTKHLCDRAHQVLSLELDERLIPLLEAFMAGRENFRLVQGDVMTADLGALTADLRKPFSVVANIPYYITTPLITRLLTSGLPIRRMALMVQKEVAEKILSCPGEDGWGPLAVRCQYCCVPELKQIVPAGCFTPAPKVDSAFILMTLRDRPPVEARDERSFFEIVTAAFALRRKTMTNGLIASLRINREDALALMAAAGLDEKIRGERLTLAQLADLANAWADWKEQKETEGPAGSEKEEDMIMSQNACRPIRMHPAFRGGKLTPWGGEKLRTVFGKEIAEVPTGESLEISCIPGLESTDDDGRKLTDLIAEQGERYVGRYAGKAFPLLLKLIDAREPLSVQVHPDDAYAHDHENGKLGKTEAWLILDCPEGAELVYGIVPGTDLATLRRASEAGSAVAPLLRRVKVRPGDVCNIPAGTVHAIGAGILLYEIQQSSDVTYRFYDWDRVDAKGQRRELHIDKALDVTHLDFAPDPKHWDGVAGVTRMLEEPFFSLDLIRAEGEAVALPQGADFGFLTALDEGLTLCWEGEEVKMRKGESFFLPRDCARLWIKGSGRAALSMPRGSGD